MSAWPSGPLQNISPTQMTPSDDAVTILLQKIRLSFSTAEKNPDHLY